MTANHCRTPDLCALFGRRFFPGQKYGSTEPFRIKECLPAVLRGGVLRVSVLDVHEHPQLERETPAERVRDNYYRRASLGSWPGGPAPYGFSIGRLQRNARVER